MNRLQESRRAHNADLIRRMREGEALCAIDSAASWFPPRPIIPKDGKELRRLYGDNVKPLGPVRLRSS